MPVVLSLLVTLVGLLLALYVLKNIKTHKLDFRHGLFWLVLASLIVLSAWIYPLLRVVAETFGIENVSSMAFFFALVLLIYLSFTYSRALSKQRRQVTKLTQELALLRRDLEGGSHQ
ncbi:hypothetical protein J2S49_001791 [Arcanobacterium wilhelmae]|uniref:DUF2304 domain-containing protein n=1 Tax=Arcanobacterium wilhelmae TaxID=1803177 RepID=A0ABT9NDB1_9ACTO|nr:DUF2304 domain-containing protein [Arcanobacterium wilhelmae]MDP9801715.1 hypothetical protein [Arcanobacterium wilhelmae]WFN91034.1 DUF2304 domain-containing protein [Arcanobacterium wilhelmae]